MFMNPVLSLSHKQKIHKIEKRIKIVLLFYLFTIIIVISISHAFAQEFKEYESELLSIKLKYPSDWDDNMKEEKSTISEDNHRSISFDLGAENALRIYIHDTDPEIGSLNNFITNTLNSVTLDGTMPIAVHFLETDLNVTLSNLQAIKLIYDRNLMLGTNSRIDTIMQVVALSDDNSQTYGVTYRTEKAYFEEYLKSVEEIIESIEIVNK